MFARLTEHQHWVVHSDMRFMVIRFLIIVSFLCWTNASAQPDDPSQPLDETMSQVEVSEESNGHAEGASNYSGAELYQRYCALCHGENREGYAADHAPSLRSPEFIGKAPGGYLWWAIAYGRPGTAMAGFEDKHGGPISHDAMHALMDWLFESSGVERDPVEDRLVAGDAELGESVYQAHCSTCHGPQGEGGTGTALANPVFLATASDAFIHHSVNNGRSGTPMPGFSDTLTDGEIDNVVAYLRSRAVGWTASYPTLRSPPNPENSILNPTAVPATLVEREGRFVSAESVAAALERGERMVLLDARPSSDWQRSHLPGALPMPFYDGVDNLIPHLPNDGTPIIAYCACPHAASGQVVDSLIEAGFTGARILDEGVLVWAARGYPIAVGTTP